MALADFTYCNRIYSDDNDFRVEKVDAILRSINHLVFKEIIVKNHHSTWVNYYNFIDIVLNDFSEK